MCRLAAYLGKEISLEDFLMRPPHSLYCQSWQPREMREATLNADGFGLGWYHNTTPMRYRETVPIWNDANLPALTQTLKQALWIANIRSATPGQGSGIDNTHPFQSDNILFVHNGLIRDFDRFKAEIINQLDASESSQIHGDTDSEYLFILLLRHLAGDIHNITAWKNFIEQCQSLFHETETLLNFIISDGQSLAAIRYAIHAQAPSLYYLDNGDSFPDSVVIASEALTEDKQWQSMSNGQLLLVNQHREITLTDL